MDISFEQWKAAVNREVIAICGLSCDDLPDVNYRDLYESEVTADDAAREVLTEAEFPFEDDEFEE